MTLMRWTPQHDLPTLPSEVWSIQKEINRMFDNFFRGVPGEEDLHMASWDPAVDVAESDDAYVVKVELPGMSRDDVKIVAHDRQLTIRGEKKQEKDTKGARYHRTERSYGAFQRTFALPSGVKPDKIDASYTNGVLTITLPKADEARAKEIEVHVK